MPDKQHTVQAVSKINFTWHLLPTRNISYLQENVFCIIIIIINFQDFNTFI